MVGAGSGTDMRVVGYAYPWDVLGDPGFVDRVRALGITRVALAAAYHTTRAATPWHPSSRLVDARSAALYRPVRREAWEGRRLVPADASWVADADPFGSAARILHDAGIEVAAWVVLTHATHVGDANPDVTVVNCFGEAYPYALCPQAEPVREYAATLAAEAVREVSCASIILEACGQLGVQHGGHHEKTDGAYDAATARLLSICCCLACQDAWRARGLDPGDVTATLRAGTEPGRAGAVPAALLDVVLQVRQAGTDALRRAVLDALDDAPGDPEIVLHAQPDPWVTGALPGLTPSAPDDADVVVSQCWAVGEASVRTVRELVAALDGRAAAGAYVTVLPPTTSGEFGPYLNELAETGIGELHLYHLGLAGPDRQPMLARAAESRSDIENMPRVR